MRSRSLILAKSSGAVNSAGLCLTLTWLEICFTVEVYLRMTMPLNAKEATPRSDGGTPELIPEDLALEIRKLAHDLSNALEIIVQTSYLLSTADLKQPASDWLQMLDSGVDKALEINLTLRTFIKSNSPK